MTTLVPKTAKTGLARVCAAFGLLTAVACGPGAEFSANLALPTDQPTQVTVTPALDLSGLPQADWQDRVVIEHISIHLEDVRLLGADPRIPSGGLDLLDAPQIIAADGRPRASVKLSFPAQFATGEDLAVFLRIAPAEVLEGASVEIFGRLYESAPKASQSRLSNVDPDVEPARGEEQDNVDPDVEPARGEEEQDNVDPDVEPAHEQTGNVDPDVEPARGEDRDGNVDPDVEPARAEDSDQNVDPDVEPAHDMTRNALVLRPEDDVPSVPFVLRDETAADMVATLGARAQLDVVVGIPASRWFNDEVVNSLELALTTLRERGASLANSSREDLTTGPDVSVDSAGVVEVRRSRMTDGSVQTQCRPLFLTSDEAIDRNRLDR